MAVITKGRIALVIPTGKIFSTIVNSILSDSDLRLQGVSVNSNFGPVSCSGQSADIHFFVIIFNKGKSIVKIGDVTLNLHAVISPNGKCSLTIFGYTPIAVPRCGLIRSTFSQT